MKRVIHVDAPAQTERMSSPGLKPWWRTCSIEEFKSRVVAMPHHHVRSLINEIEAVISITSATVHDVQQDTDRRRRARIALSYMVERRRTIKAILAEHNIDLNKSEDADERERRRLEAHEIKERARTNRVDSARDALAQGDLATALSHILDILDRKVSQ